MCKCRASCWLCPTSAGEENQAAAEVLAKSLGVIGRQEFYGRSQKKPLSSCHCQHWGWTHACSLPLAAGRSERQNSSTSSFWQTGNPGSEIKETSLSSQLQEVEWLHKSIREFASGWRFPEPRVENIGSLSSSVDEVPAGIGWTKSYHVLQDFKKKMACK